MAVAPVWLAATVYAQWQHDNGRDPCVRIQRLAGMCVCRARDEISLSELPFPPTAWAKDRPLALSQLRLCVKNLSCSLKVLIQYSLRLHRGKFVKESDVLKGAF